MVQGRTFRPRKRRRHLDDEEAVKPRAMKPNQDRFGLMALQQRVGNQAVQRMLGQRQTEEQEKAAQAPVLVGQLEVEKPKIEYYEVAGKTLAEVSNQVLPAGQWYQYEYRQVPKVENGVVIRIDITVEITLHLPRWVGPTWEQAPDGDKLEWLRILQALDIDLDKYEEEMLIPQKWLQGPNWPQASEAEKKEWQRNLLSFQTREQSPLDIVRRRVMVLQQRLFGQPEAQIKAIFDQFLKDLKIEQEVYDRQTRFGERQQISLNNNLMIQ